MREMEHRLWLLLFNPYYRSVPSPASVWAMGESVYVRGMDPKIQAIMAKLNSDEPQEGKVQDNKGKILEEENNCKPPQTFEEFLKAEKLDEWPQRLTLENLLDLQDERDLLGSKENIVAELKSATPLDMKFLQDIEDRLTDFEAKLHKYGSFIVNIAVDDVEPSKETRSILPSVNKAFLTDMDLDILKVHPGRQGKAKQLDFADQVCETRKKNVEYCSFPGFRPGELTELPGQLESPQILNRVTKAQDFNPGFRKFWKKIFLSEASVAMMQDSFWWFFLSNFGKVNEEDRSRLFDRIADSFVALFNSVNPEIKDKVFSVYADCLAQALFASFREAFSESDRHFSDSFKQQLVTTTTEWVSGLKPVEGSWKKWNVSRLEPKSFSKATVSASKKATSNNTDDDEHVKARQTLDMDDFHRVMNHLGDDKNNQLATALNAFSPLKAITALHSRGQDKFGMPSAHTTTMHGTGHVTVPVTVVPPISPSRQAICGTPKKEPQMSHPIGPGPELERIMFSIQGRSPLVAHYFHMRQLRSNEHHGKRLRRTEVANVPMEGPTYREVIKQTMATQDTLSKEYQRVCDLTNQEIKKIENQQRETNRRIEQLQKEITFCKNSQEIKYLSEKMMDTKEQERTIVNGKKKSTGNR